MRKYEEREAMRRAYGAFDRSADLHPGDTGTQELTGQVSAASSLEVADRPGALTSRCRGHTARPLANARQRTTIQSTTSLELCRSILL